MWSQVGSWKRILWARFLCSPIYGWTEKQWVRFVSAVLGATALFFLLWNLWNSRADAIYAITGLVLIWYTVETWAIRWQMVRQNEMAIRPLVLATVESRPTKHDLWAPRVVLRNIGRGPALFVRMDEFATQEIRQEGTRVLSRIPPVDCIEVGKDRDLPVEVVVEADGKELWTDSGTNRLNYVAMLNPETARETYHIKVRYEDTYRRMYWAEVQMGKAGIRLLDHGEERKV